jgi:multiple antibiotic resistance protein
VSELTVYLEVFIALYVLVNPLEGIPMFLARTQGASEELRRAVARTAAFGVTSILLASLLVGHPLLEVLGISIGAFSVAGGVIIFLIALTMVLGSSGSSKPTRSPDEGSEDLRRFALVPLATPLLAGPGAIGTVIVYASRGGASGVGELEHLAVLAGIVFLVGTATWFALRAADPLRELLGDTGIDVSTRISGILVAAIAVGMIQQGLVALFPILGR